MGNKIKNKRFDSPTFVLIFLIIFFIVSLGLILNMDISTRQAINYKVSSIHLPLYLKTLDFFDRHYNYKVLVRRILQNEQDESNKVFKIFEWTLNNLAHQPLALDTVDDHVWHIIIRRYGTTDQFSDVFTTLCNYAGNRAFFVRLVNKKDATHRPFAFVEIQGAWRVFDTYNGIYFVKKDLQDFATIEDLASENWRKKSIKPEYSSNLIYEDYFSKILDMDYELSHKYSRANIQSPVNRLFYAIKKKIKIAK